MNWWMPSRLLPRLPYFSNIYIPVFYLIFPSNCWSHCLTNMVGMVSSVSLTLFMSYTTDRAMDGEITNITFLKVFLAELAVASWLPSLFMFCSQSRKRVLYFGNECILYPLHIHLHIYKRHKTQFLTFKTDNAECITQVKQGHEMCLASMFVKDDVAFRDFPKILD